MSVKIRPHSTSKGIYYINDKQVVVDRGFFVSSEKLTNEEEQFFNEFLKAFNKL